MAQVRTAEKAKEGILKLEGHPGQASARAWSSAESIVCMPVSWQITATA